MGMNETTSWNTNRDLSRDGKKMSVVSINGTMMEMNSHAQKGFSSLVQSVAFNLSWSPTMNQFFYQNDERKSAWAHKSDKAVPRPKGDGQSIMVSDFLTSDWGRLRDDNECVSFFIISLYLILTWCHDREARIIFKARKNRNGWFGSEHLIVQVDKAIDIFEGLTKGNAQGLFLFDNAPSHQKCAPDAISARKMVKGA